MTYEGAWDFSVLNFDVDDDLVALGADLEPQTVLAAYPEGVFPMEVSVAGHMQLGWWSPLQRGVMRPGALRVTRSLRKSARKFQVTTDVVFPAVMRACADPERDGGWITDEFIATYTELHERGHAHSVEVWQDDDLVGGLYGLQVGGLFAGESMFHRATDASKVALMALCDLQFTSDEAGSERLIDMQWLTPHLQSLGGEEVARAQYRDEVRHLMTVPAPSGWGRSWEPPASGVVVK